MQTSFLLRHNSKGPATWAAVTPVYSCIITRLVYVLDAERGIYPVTALSLRASQPR